jgi:hypothetical protein
MQWPGFFRLLILANLRKFDSTIFGIFPVGNGRAANF